MTTVITYKYSVGIMGTMGWWLTNEMKYEGYNMKDALRCFWHHSLLTGDHRIDYKECYKITDVREIR